MPLENLEEESLPKNPDLELAQMKFVLVRHEPHNDKLKQDLMTAITEHNMAPFYEETCAELGWTVDADLLANMKLANATEIVRLDSAIEDAEKNLSETEVREAHLAKAEYLSRIGDKEAALAQIRKTYDKTLSLGQKMDLLFHVIRIGLFYLDHDLITRNIDKAKSLIEERGDWDRRNRLKVYQALYSIAVRDFKGAATLLLDTVSTFTCYELMDYQRFVTYAVLASMISLSRVELREKTVFQQCITRAKKCDHSNAVVIHSFLVALRLDLTRTATGDAAEDKRRPTRYTVVQGAEILQVLHGVPDIYEYLLSLYKCRYAIFFRKLAYVEQLLLRDRLWAPHVRYYVREMRILAYSQLLQSYRSLTLQYMADTFGVTVSFIDQELARFIAAGRLHCKIDKVGGVVESMRPDSKNLQYQSCIRQGDILLNRIQKLSRVINM